MIKYLKECFSKEQSDKEHTRWCSKCGKRMHKVFLLWSCSCGNWSL